MASHEIKPSQIKPQKAFRHISLALCDSPLVRNLGYVPDPAHLRKGDIIIFKSNGVNPAASLVKGLQMITPGTRMVASWYHPAIVVGEFEVCEAVRPKVKKTSLCDYVGNEYHWKVRRMPNLTEAEENLIVKTALEFLGDSYSLSSAGRDILRHFQHIPPTPATDGAVVCSTFCQRVYFIATGKDILSGSSYLPLPGIIAKTKLLKDVRVPWAMLA